MPNDTIYRRVPGSGRSANSLWFCADHLLSVHYKVFSQDYKRYYYSDIQALMTCKNDSFKIVNAILAGSSVFLIFLAFFLGEEGTAISGVMGGIFLLLFLVYMGWGPDCVCFIKTAVQIEKLPSLSRTRRVEKVIAFLRPVIKEAQGEITPEAVEENLSASSFGEAAGTTFHQSATQRKKKVHEPGHWHIALYVIMIISGLYSLILINNRSVPLIAGETFLTLGVWILVIIALVKQQNSNLPKGILNIGWAMLVYICFEFITSTVFYMVIIFKNVNNPRFTGDQLMIMRSWADMSPLENPYLMGSYVVSISVLLGLGGLGLVLLRNFQVLQKKTS